MRVLVAAIFSAVGVILIVYAPSIQRYAIRREQAGRPQWLPRMPDQSWLYSSAYVWSLRVIGAVCIIAVLAMLVSTSMKGQ